jgi:threonine/homoserine/homoserine lactone efflux protein
VDVSALVRGLVLGFSIAAVVGPIALLCIRRTLAGGFLAGLISGLGVATADGLYAAVAAFGLTAISDLLVGEQLWLRLIGGLFLLYLGLQALRTQPAERAAPVSAASGLGLYVSTLGLTLANPATILSFAALFAGLGLGETGGSLRTAASLVAGTFVGSACWWLVLSTVVAALRDRLAPQLLRTVNLVAGLVISLFGLAALLSAWAMALR